MCHQTTVSLYEDGGYCSRKRRLARLHLPGPEKKLFIMCKLDYYGNRKILGVVHGKLLNWMENYLKGKQVRTFIRGNVSSWVKVSSGVLKGLVLALIMF